MKESLFKNIEMSEYGYIDTNVSLEDELAGFTETLERMRQPLNQAMGTLNRTRYLVAGLESSDRLPTPIESELINFTLESLTEQMRLTGIAGFEAVSLESEDESKDVSAKGKGIAKRTLTYIVESLKRIGSWIKVKFKQFIDIVFGRQKKIDKKIEATKRQLKEARKKARRDSGLKDTDGVFYGDPTDKKPWKFLIDTHGEVKLISERTKYGSKPIIAGSLEVTVDVEDGPSSKQMKPMVTSNQPINEDTLRKIEEISELGKRFSKDLKAQTKESDKLIEVAREKMWDIDPSEFDKNTPDAVSEVHRLLDTAKLINDGLTLTRVFHQSVATSMRQYDAGLAEINDLKD